MQVRLGLHVDGAFLAALLDDAVGHEGWSFGLQPWGDDGLVASLKIGGAERAACVRVVRGAAWSLLDVTEVASPDVAATDVAMWAAARAWGASASVDVAEDAWVEADSESGTPLHAPAVVTVGARGAGAKVGAGGGAGGAELDGAAHGDERPAPSDTHAPPAGDQVGSEGDKPEGRRMIDRLVERLGDAGFGAQAARLVMRHGGYGADAEASRELYAELRALWVGYAGGSTGPVGVSSDEASPHEGVDLDGNVAP